MPDASRPIGHFYTHVYTECPTSLTDNPRLRFRVSEYFFTRLFEVSEEARALIHTEIGVDAPGHYDSEAVRDFLKSAELNDFLNALTAIWRVLNEQDGYSGDSASQWIAFVNRVMIETGVAFELDQKGGCHPRIDSAFVANRQTALVGLEKEKHTTAREHFEVAYAALDGASPRTGHAIIEMHLALETVFKQAYSRATKLDVGEITNVLKPRVVARLKGPELEAAKLMLTSAGNFISAGHHFRHANGAPEPVPPSMDVTIWMLSQGTAFLRWLVAFVEVDVD